MIEYLQSTTINVRDQDAAIGFYVDTLGWELTSDAPYEGEARWVTVRPKGSATALSLFRSDEAPVPGQFNSGITFVTKDIDKAYTELVARGVRFDGPPETMPWGAKATWFNDPDGNNFFLIEEA